MQRRFHELVTAKLAETERRIAALQAFSDQLRVAATRLAEPPVDGPCDERCACLADQNFSGDGPLSLDLGLL